MHLLFEHIVDRSALHDLPGINHRDILTVLGHHAQVVGNQQQSGVQLFPQVSNGLQYLGLNGHVQRRGRLIRNQHLRIAGQGDADDHPLLHATGKLMGIVCCPLRCNPDQFQDFSDPLLCLPPAAFLVSLHRLGNLIPHRNDRVQACHGVLEDHGDVLAADLAQLLGAHFQQIFPVVQDLAGLDLPIGFGRQAHDPFRHGGLSGTRLTHQAV